jgi:hypothetical protein
MVERDLVEGRGGRGEETGGGEASSSISAVPTAVAKAEYESDKKGA